MVRVGHVVNMAVERFVKVGEAIARENPDIQHDMCNACQEAKAAGNVLLKSAKVIFLKDWKNIQHQSWITMIFWKQSSSVNSVILMDIHHLIVLIFC